MPSRSLFQISTECVLHPDVRVEDWHVHFGKSRQLYSGIVINADGVKLWSSIPWRGTRMTTHSICGGE